jgi:hypothetical protein
LKYSLNSLSVVVFKPTLREKRVPSSLMSPINNGTFAILPFAVSRSGDSGRYLSFGEGRGIQGRERPR